MVLVPTMGAIHEGHLSLARMAARSGRHVIATVFVNPLQFGPGEDYRRYPRRASQDARLFARAGVHFLYQPRLRDLYPAGFSSTVRVGGGLEDVYEGKLRPGHFQGVATVVLKLLHLTRPDLAIFGEKDLQQLAVIRTMVRDFNLPVRILAAPIVRDSGGLALSSRNEYLSAEGRLRARGLYKALRAARTLARKPGSRKAKVLSAARHVLWREFRLRFTYLGLVDPMTFEESAGPRPGQRLVASLRLEGVRLLDNIRL